MRRALATNANTSSFASKVPTITEPSGDGVINLIDGTVEHPCELKLIPFGLGDENDAFSMRILGWSKVMLNGSTDLWVPVIIGEYTCVISTAVGVAGAAVLATERFADTLAPVAARQADGTIAAGTAVNTDHKVISPVGNLIGHIVLPVYGFAKVEFQFDQTTNTPTMNTLYAFL